MTPTKLYTRPGLWADACYSEDEVILHIREMHNLLIRRFPSLDLNCGSPISLGKHLAAACWHKDKIKVPPAPPEIRDLLKANSPQGRHEILTLPHLETIPALYEYDMRLAYLWCCKGLPYGDLMRTGGNLEDGHKLYCQWAAPDDWSHINLLPERRSDWVYDTRGQGWIDRREVELAVRSGWRVRVLGDGLLWGSEGALDRWSDGLQWALRQVPRNGIIYDMLRRVALYTIGSFHRTERPVERSGAKPPTGDPTARYDPSDGLYTWSRQEPINGLERIYVHPEWTTTIWARCRARIAQMALQVPREQLIAMRQDALYTSAMQPRWEDDRPARVGDIRRKWSRGGPLPAPRTIEDLERLRKGG